MSMSCYRQRAGWITVVTAFTPVLVQAQQAPAEPETPPSGLETVVVTGSALGGVKKLEASYNIVTANEDQIRQSNPKSTADLLKISPGMWPESSGGQTGANIAIAGFPSGGDAPFFTTLLMGSPLYGMPTLSFFETTSIVRLDDTVRAVEILQGGPSVVFAGGQMGATANFLLKTGTDEPSGSLGLTYGDENLWRVDGFTGFKVGEGWYGSFGGFYRTSDGVRDPEFTADEGGQLTATLKREFDKGELILFARYLNDKNQFITPIPLIQTGTDNFHEYPGFDALTGTYYSEAIRHVRLPGYPNGGTTADLADGRGADMWFVGANYDHEFDNGWSISNKFLANAGDVDTNALFSRSNPSLLADKLYTVPTTLDGFQLPAGSATATFSDGSAVAPTQDVINQGWWFVHKELQNLNNDFRLSKEIFQDNTLTLGVYLAYYEMDDEWGQGGLGMLMTNEPNARPIRVSYVSGGQTFQLTDEQGFLDYGGFNIAQRGHAFNHAIYLSDSWRIDKWLLDASVRYENQDATNRVCNLTNRNLDGNPLTVYDNAVPQCNGTLAITDYDEDFTSWTVGANYSFTDTMSSYVRANRGGHFADFDNGIRGSTTGNTPPIQIVRNYEVGFKFQNEIVYADISAYYREFTGLQYQQTDRLGAPTGAKLHYGSESKGLNFIGALTLWENFRFQAVANYLDGEYTDYDACVPFTNVVTGNGCARIEGQQLQRQPKLRYMLTPSYHFPFDWGGIDAQVTYTHIGDRTQDQSGLQELGSYYTWDFAVIANVGENWQFAVRGTNISDELGITETNSRIFGTAAGTGGVLLARPIEGSEINFQAKYLW
ncbi:TonB-dependent receptor [Steroidobacter agaridevorans]|uniref:TonB-dependent receptor n=1 Tax=Steroidobacter agaridevorans TaxID=2695856 RepID=UPI001320CD7C|nr:TonB-dependent receptor [Steroidobacter agaridevorans]GFE90133.1 TonB-dependent receptor [Steroidobacter agaridevorans]